MTPEEVRALVYCIKVRAMTILEQEATRRPLPRETILQIVQEIRDKAAEALGQPRDHA